MAVSGNGEVPACARQILEQLGFAEISSHTGIHVGDIVGCFAGAAATYPIVMRVRSVMQLTIVYVVGL
jgi:hypothetical protein